VASTDAKEVVGEPDDHVTASSHRVAQDATSPPDSTFEMPVEDVFVIEGRGTVATGCITKGFVRNGEELTIRHPNGLEVRTVCAGLETFERKLTAAQAGDHVGLLLREVARNEIHPGALLYSVTEKDPLSEEEAQGEPQGEFQKACFIATACYGSHDCAEVLELRAFRDEVLNVGYLGRALVALYYRVSPPVATWLRRRPRLAAVLREWLLDRIVCLVRRQDRAMPNKPDAGDG